MAKKTSVSSENTIIVFTSRFEEIIWVVNLGKI